MVEQSVLIVTNGANKKKGKRSVLQTHSYNDAGRVAITMQEAKNDLVVNHQASHTLFVPSTSLLKRAARRDRVQHASGVCA